MNVFDEEYWLTCHNFPNYRISSFGRIWDKTFDEEVALTYSRGEVRAILKYGPDEFRGAVWQMMYATFWHEGWGMDVDISYRDDDARNLSIFNMLFTEKETAKPRMYRLDENTGLWERKRKNSRQVRIVETGEIFDSVPELATHLDNGSANLIYMCLRGVAKSHKGLHYEWVD